MDWINSHRMKNVRGALLLGCGLLLASGLAAQSGNPLNSNPASPLPEYSPLPAPTLNVPSNLQPDLVAPAAPDSYIIGPNDLIDVFVYQIPELTRQLRVSDRGNIRLPFVSHAFHAAGQTAPQLQRVIARSLLSQGLARNPQVQVIVRQVESKPIVVAGAVHAPLTLQAARPMRLLEVLSRAGGLNDQAGDTALVVHRAAAGMETIHHYNLVQLLRYNNQTDNPLLRGHDSVTILPARYVYVVGALNKPGAFPLRTGHPINVLRAIALAQGIKEPAYKNKAIIIRKQDGQKVKNIRINIQRILHHREADLNLQPGDVLYVPHNGMRAVLVTALQDAAEAGMIAVGYTASQGKL